MNIKSLTLGVSIALLSTNSSAVLKVDVPFVVTPTKTQQALSDVIVPTVVITREDIENTPSTDVAELLRFHAGLDIARTGGNGSQTSLFIRGTESDHVLVLIVGV
jgi:vitamin B12 transporter